jgi:flavin reductase (DIM6/NTAB) family NADH-FMN oxidoreductase RutF
MATFDMSDMGPRETYNLITGTIVPRPIALVTSVSREGSINAAPFSMFNTLGASPPIVAFSPGLHSAAPLRVKDTRLNVMETREFVVNMVTEEMIEAMTIASAVFPEQESEIDLMGVTLVPSTKVKCPRIEQSPAHLECKLVKVVEIGRNRVLFGEIVEMHIRDDLIDLEKMYIRYERINFLGRMPGGSGIYSRTTDLMKMPRIT